MTMLQEERMAQIEKLAQKSGYVSTKDLAARFEVSEPTIRADCRELERQGRILRVHGGAKSAATREILTRRQEPDMNMRSDRQQQAKEELCRYAASLVHEDDSIFIDGGTTFASMMKYLRGKNVKIVTHSKIVLDSFAPDNGDLFMLGGTYSPKYQMNLGPAALQDLDSYNFRYAFLSCAGIDAERGKAYTAELDTAEIKKRAMKLAEKSFLLIDSSKQNITGFCSFASLDDFTGVITDHAGSVIGDNFILTEEA